VTPLHKRALQHSSPWSPMTSLNMSKNLHDITQTLQDNLGVFVPTTTG
jgi:hypothetical protein